MEIDLSKKLLKVWPESERSVHPDETIERALDAIKTLGVDFEITFEHHGGVFWTSTMVVDLNSMNSHLSCNFRIGGKGRSRKQCHASCLMEFIERWSLFRPEIMHQNEFECFDLRSEQYYKINRTIDFEDTKCVSSGNNFEEAVLHSLHELIETRRSCIWKPHKLVEINTLFSSAELPGWVADNIVLIRMPSDHDEFHIFTAVMNPSDQRFDARVSDFIEKKSGRLFYKSHIRPINYHSPHSGGAAGLNPAITAFRAMNEIFQGDVGDIEGGKRKKTPDFVQTAEPTELINYESDAINDDIKFILKKFGDDVFVGIVDLTDPAIEIPVVKLITDYDPRQSIMSKQVLELFFELE